MKNPGDIAEILWHVALLALFGVIILIELTQ